MQNQLLGLSDSGNLVGSLGRRTHFLPDGLAVSPFAYVIKRNYRGEIAAIGPTSLLLKPGSTGAFPDCGGSPAWKRGEVFAFLCPERWASSAVRILSASAVGRVHLSPRTGDRGSVTRGCSLLPGHPALRGVRQERRQRMRDRCPLDPCCVSAREGSTLGAPSWCQG